MNSSDQSGEGVWRAAPLEQAKAEVEALLLKASNEHGYPATQVTINLFFDGSRGCMRAVPFGLWVGVRVASVDFAHRQGPGSYCGSSLEDSPGQGLEGCALVERAILYRMVHMESDDESQLGQQAYIDECMLAATVRRPRG